VDVLIDLLPSVNQVQTERSKKDKRQRNKYSRQMSSALNHASVSSGVENSAAIKHVFWKGYERRSSVNRPKLKDKRGRWLESRDRSDRRATKYGISVKI
jgi:predicted flavoprotein YhiN